MRRVNIVATDVAVRRYAGDALAAVVIIILEMVVVTKVFVAGAVLVVVIAPALG